MEGASVTLTCNSDANPPVHNYTWYKKYSRTESSLIGSGQKYSISHARPVHRGRYYCKAENKVGATASTTLPVHVHSEYSYIQLCIRSGINVYINLVLLALTFISM